MFSKRKIKQNIKQNSSSNILIYKIKTQIFQIFKTKLFSLQIQNQQLQALQNQIKQLCYQTLVNYPQSVYDLLEVCLNFYATDDTLLQLFWQQDENVVIQAAICHLLQIRTNLEIDTISHNPVGLRKRVGDENIPLIIKILTDIIIILQDRTQNSEVKDIIIHYERHSIQCYSQMLKFKEGKSFDLDMIVNFLQQTRYELPLYIYYSIDDQTDEQLKKKMIRLLGRIQYLKQDDLFIQLQYIQQEKQNIPDIYNECILNNFNQQIIKNGFLGINGYAKIKQDTEDLSKQLSVLLLRADKQYELIKQLMEKL